MQGCERRAELRWQIFIRQNTLQGCLPFGILPLSQNGFLEHLWSDLCTGPGITKGTRRFHERVHTARRLGNTPERREKMKVVPGASKSIDESGLVVFSFLHVVFCFFLAPQHVNPLWNRERHGLQSEEAPDAISVTKVSGSSDAPEIGLPPRARLSRCRHSKLRCPLWIDFFWRGCVFRRTSR